MGQELVVGCIACAAALLAAYAVAVAIRFNQLTLARGVVREGWRQLDLALRERRELVPHFQRAIAPVADTGAGAGEDWAESMQPAPGGPAPARRQAAEALSRALAAEAGLLALDTAEELSPSLPGSDARSARRKSRWYALHANELGQAEHRLSMAVRAAWEHADFAADPAGADAECAHDLLAQLEHGQARIAGSVRLFNYNVRSFNTRLKGLSALPLRFVFRPFSEISGARGTDRAEAADTPAAGTAGGAGADTPAGQTRPGGPGSADGERRGAGSETAA